MKRIIGRPAVRMLTVALAFAALFAAHAVAPAHAWTQTNTGCPGLVQVPRTNGYSTYSTGPAFEFPQRFAWRSSCYSTSTQVINVRYRLWAFNLQTRQWVYYTNIWRTGTVAPGYSGAWMMGWGAGSLWANISGDVLVEWRLTTGALIGSTYIDYNSVGDYACPLGGACKVYSDPVVGAYLHFG